MNNTTAIEHFVKEELLKIVKLMGFGAAQEKFELEILHQENTIQFNLNFTPLDACYLTGFIPEEKQLGALLIGRNGRTLHALGIILQSITNHQFKDRENVPKISIDVNQYNFKLEQKIIDIVNKAVNTVKKTNMPYKLLPMPSRIRRKVHMLLRENTEFESISEGEGYNRYVVIRPKGLRVKK